MKLVKLCLAIIMSMTMVGCSSQKKSLEEIESILNDNGYSFKTYHGCDYAGLGKDDHRWVMEYENENLYFRDSDVDGGAGVVNLNDKKLYVWNELSNEIDTEEGKNRASLYIDSSTSKLKKLNLNTNDLVQYISDNFSKEKEAYDQLSSKEKLKKIFLANTDIDKLSDDLADSVYTYYCAHKLANLNASFSELCENFVNDGPYSSELSKYHSLLTKNNGIKPSTVEVETLISNDNEFAVFYELSNNGKSYSNINYVVYYDTGSSNVKFLTCLAQSTVDKTDFYIWSMVMINYLTENDYSSNELLSILSKSVSDVVTIGNWSFYLKMDDNYSFVAIPK